MNAQVRNVPVFTYPNAPGWWIRVHGSPWSDPLCRMEYINQEIIEQNGLPPGGFWVWSPLQDGEELDKP